MAPISEMLRHIEPRGGTAAAAEGVDVEAAWTAAAADIVGEHNLRADPRAAQEGIGPAQRWAVELLRDPTVLLPEGAERAEAALRVARSSSVRRAVNEVRAAVSDDRISRNEAAARVVALVDESGLQPVSLADAPDPITEDDLGVVCWMVVMPSA